MHKSYGLVCNEPRVSEQTRADKCLAIWIVSYTTLVFGLETSLRSPQRKPFRPRSRWHIPTCIAGVAILVIITRVTTVESPSNDQCLARLIWWTADYALIGVATASGLILLCLINSVVIGVQLRRSRTVDGTEKIAAKRLVFYLVNNTVILVRDRCYYISFSEISC